MSFRWFPLPRRGQVSRRNVVTASERAKQTRRRMVLEPLEERQLMSANLPILPTTWTPIGPAPIDTSGVGGTLPAAGRVTGIATDPTDPKTIYLATAGGGVWKSVDAGVSWGALLDNGPSTVDGKPTTANTLPANVIGAIAVAPSKPAYVYAGTGEANNSPDSFSGAGILASTDGGSTWSLSTDNGTFQGLTTARIVVDPTNQNVVYAAMSGGAGTDGVAATTGVYKSTDGGATWINTTASISPTASYTDLAIDPGDINHQTLYAAVGSPQGDIANGVYKSINGGGTWALVGAQLPRGTGDGRIALAISTTTTPVTLYAAIVGSGQNGTTYGGLNKVEKSTDGGTTWTDVSFSIGLQDPFGFFSPTGWYDVSLAVDPSKASTVYLGGSQTSINNTGTGSNLFESIDGGTTWINISKDTTGRGPGAGSHAMAFDSNGKLLEGDDGGINRLVDPAQATLTWANLNANLQITDVNSVALAPNNANSAYIGTQANGVDQFSDSLTWKEIRPYDTGQVLVDASTTPPTLYREVGRLDTINSNYFTGLEKSIDGGGTWTDITPFDYFDKRNYYQPVVMDPSNPKRLLYGSDHLYESINGGTTWRIIGNPNNGRGTFNPGGARIDAIAIAPSSRNTIYVTAGGSVYVTTNDGTSWTTRNVLQANDHFSALTVDPKNSLTAYIVRDRFDNVGSQGHVFMTVNGGATWTDISGSLPNAPVVSLTQVNVLGIKELFVGTNTGVYYTRDQGATWAQFESGLPDVRVDSLAYDPATNILAAGTHGRGVYEVLGNVLLRGLPAPLTNAVEGNLQTIPSLATFVDTGGTDPLGNYTATIDWGDGTPTSLGTITGSSVFNVAGAHTYAEAGPYTITISLSDKDGAIGQIVNTITVDDAALTPTSVAIAPVEGQPFDGTVVTFTDGNPTAPLSDFSATINWGDNNNTIATIAQNPDGSFSVSGTNTYLEEGTYNVNVSITDVDGATLATTIPVTVADAHLNGVPLGVSATEGTAFFNQTVAQFTDADPNGTPNDYTATINWGDGSLPDNNVPVTLGGGGVFSVPGSHVYAEDSPAGKPYTVKVTVRDKGGAPPITISSTETVLDAALSAIGTTVSSVEQQAIPAGTILATFTDNNPAPPLSDFSATVNWGDGITTSAPGSIVSLGNGKYGVAAGYTYQEENTLTLPGKTRPPYNITVTINDVGGSTTQAQSSAQIVDAVLTATPMNFSAVEGQPNGNQTVAQFSDANPFALASDFTVTIDWGDGVTPQTTLQPTALGGGNFLVSAPVLYKKAGSFPVTVTIKDVGGSSTQAVATATVADATLTAGAPFTFQATEGLPFKGATATFTDNNPYASAADFLASINWGDGSSSNAVVTKTATDANGNPIFSLSDASAGHTYPEETPANQSLPVSVQIVDMGGARVTLTGTANVNDAALTVYPVGALKVNEGTTVSRQVAFFSDAYANAPATDYAATIDWGDGTTSPGSISFYARDKDYLVNGTHTYADEGTYSINVTVKDVGGAQATQATPTAAVIADAPLFAGPGVVQPIAGQPFSGVIGGFADANHNAPLSDFTTTINWGDGAITAGGLIQPGGPGTAFYVTGTHTYAFPSAGLPFSFTIQDRGGSSTTTGGNAHVLVPLSGGLDPASDTGVSNSDGITSNTQPLFRGRGEPNSIVQLFAAPLNAPGNAFEIGQNVADAQGNWIITTSTLADGAYSVFANAIDPVTNALTQSVSLMPSANRPPLVIDTTGPTVASVLFDPRAGQLHITLQSGPAGLNPGSLFNAGNFQLGVPAGFGAQNLPVTGLFVNQTNPTQATVNVSYNLGRRSRSGTYVVTINAFGVTDLAGNTLVERTFVTFPQTTNAPNPNYVAQFVVRNGSVTGPSQFIPPAERAAANRFANSVQGGVRVRRR